MLTLYQIVICLPSGKEWKRSEVIYFTQENAMKDSEGFKQTCFPKTYGEMERKEFDNFFKIKLVELKTEGEVSPYATKKE